MKLIPLNTRKKCKHPNAPTHAMVDDEDYDMLINYSWYAQKLTNRFYAHSGVNNGKGKSSGKLLMHRLIIGVTDKNIEIDHKDHNGVNNQKTNLRLASQADNARNCSAKKNGTSQYLGVHKYIPKTKWKEKTYIYPPKWQAIIGFEYKRIGLGYFPFTPEGEIEAAKAYDKKAKELFGEFANLNFK